MRHAHLDRLIETLREQHDRKLDVLVSAGSLRSAQGDLRVEHLGAQEITEEGVTSQPGAFMPTSTLDDGLAAKLRIPRAYLRRMRESGRTALVDHNVNTWLDADPAARFLLRAYASPTPGGRGVARALLSASYKPMDNYPVLLAALRGVKDAGVAVDIPRADLSERHMYVPFTAPSVTATAPVLLGDYRSPFDGGAGQVVQAGFVLSNSEVGQGALSLRYRMLVRVCSNGMVVPEMSQRAVHLGALLDDGVVDWSDHTRRTALELIEAKVRDTARAYLDPALLRRTISRLQQECGMPLDKPVAAITHVAAQQGYSDAETQLILDHYVRGADTSAGGVLHAVTSAAQTVADPDRAYALEASGVPAMREAALFAAQAR